VSSNAPQRLSPLDMLFLYGERPETMMHVASLMRFQPPADASPSFLRELADEARRNPEVHSPWNRKLRHARLVASPLQSWVVDQDFDIDYHVRRSALASPGDERELGVLISRLHSNPLDLSRPPWELHLIEGLEDGRFAVYVKMHHALVDGYSGVRLMARSLSKDPGDRELPLFWSVPPRPRSAGEDGDREGGLGLVSDLGSLVRGTAKQAGSAVTLSRRIVEPLVRRGRFPDLIGLPQAPRSILNHRIGRNRRFATQQYELAHLKRLGAPYDATLNDVFLAIVGGGLRRFLSELGELPEAPLVAFLPVNVRPKGDEGGGNAVGAILATLATDTDDPVERLQRITASTRSAKAQLEGMTQEAILAYSAYLLAPGGLQALGALAGIRAPLPLGFNVCVSNVPGPREPRYLRGARMEAYYPASIPIHGMALNITVLSYAGTLNVGFIGDRDALPHLQRLAVYTGEALAELDQAIAVA
jgi:diacylglycerol O-acyltransferase / wax synthase